VALGVAQAGAQPEIQVDRRSAIREALLRLKHGDVLLVAGKGHEPYQEVDGVRHHFNDREEVLEAVQCLL
jgi:UDP-N-acetylmuramoyl-L-alanyl-D-glutamate--2,6-diaminopimelate ligase